VQQALLISAAAVVLAVGASWALGRWLPQAAWLRLGGAVAARLLGAAALAWAVAQALRKDVDLASVAFAVFASLIGLWLAVTALGMLVLVLVRRGGFDGAPRAS
jgi:hypothetical protein